MQPWTSRSHSQFRFCMWFPNLEPLVTIIIPTYNSMSKGKCLDRTLKSIFGQTYRVIEVIIVDESSIDATLKVCTQYPVRILKSRGGRSVARNVGIENASGQFLMFLDSDMVLDSRVVEECVRACLEKGYHGLRIPIRHKVLEPIPSRLWDIVEARNVELRVQSFPSDILFWSRRAIGDTRFAEDLSLGEDLCFQSPLIRKGAPLGTVSSRLTHYFLARSSLSEVLTRSYGYGKLYAKQRASASFTLLSRSISPVGLTQGCFAIRSLVEMRSLRLFITIPFYLLVKYLGFVLGFIPSLVRTKAASSVRAGDRLTLKDVI